MNWQFTPYTLPLLIMVIVSAALALSAWRRRTAPGALPFLILMLAVAEWSLGYALRLSSANLPAKLFWTRVRYLGIVVVPVAWLVFVLQYTGREKWLTRRNLALLTIEPLIVLLLAWTNDLHHLIWSRIELQKTGGSLWVWKASHGVAFWTHAAYSYVLVLLGTVLLIQALVRRPHLYRGQSAALLIGALAPVIGNVISTFDLMSFPLDLTPFAFTLAGLAVAWALFRSRLLDIVPVARRAIVDGMSDGVVVLDVQDRVLDLNLAAQDIIGRYAADVIGQPAEQAMADFFDLIERHHDVTEARDEIRLGEGETQCDIELRISPLHDRHQRPTGKLVVLRDITERKRVEEELRRQALAFANISDSVILTNLEGRIIDCNPATEKMFGYSKAELLGQPPRIWHRPEESDALTADIIEGLKHTGRWSGDVNFIRKDGSTGVCEVVAVPLLDQRGERIATIGVSHDVTERVRAEEALLAQKQMFENLVAVARATAERPDLEDTLRNVLAVAAKLTGAEHSRLALLNESGAVTHSLLAHGQVAIDGQQDIITGATKDGLDGWIARHRQFASIRDTSQDERWLALPDAPHTAGSVLVVPILSAGSVLGVLTLTHSKPGHFDAEHTRLMRAAADQMALAVRNAQIFDAQRRTAERQTTLYQVLRAAAEQTDPDYVTRAAIEAITKIAGWSNVLIALPDEEETDWVIPAAGGALAPMTGRKYPIERGVIGRAFRTAQPQRVPQVSADPDYVAGNPATRSQLAVPLRHAERILGVLSVESNRLDAFDADDVLLAELLGEAVALALDRARLYSEAHRHAVNLSALYTITRLSSQSLVLEDVLAQVLSSALTLLGFDAGLIGLADQTGGQLRLVAERGLPSVLSERLRREGLDNTLCTYVHDRKQELVVRDLGQEIPAGGPVDQGFVQEMAALGFRGYAGIPLLHREQSLGSLNLFSHRLSPSAPDDLTLLTSIGHQVATAVANARLFQAITAEHSRLQALIESSRDGIILIGTDQRVLLINAPAIKLLQLPGEPEDLSGQPVQEVLAALQQHAPDVVQASMAEMRRVQRGDEPPGEGEYQVPPRTLHWLNLPVLTGDTPLGRLLVLHDVTEERLLEKMRDDLTHTMVHDLRSPLTGISVSLQFLAKKRAENLTLNQRQMLGIARDSTEKMIELVNNILDLSRLESGRMPLNRDSISVPDLIAETLHTQSPLATDKGLHLTSDAPMTLPLVWADPELVGRVLQNLVGNAIKFTLSGGQIKVSARQANGDAANQPESPYLCVSVADDGPGIPPDLQGQLFQKFVTGQQEGSGSGLGLAFCKLVVETHGGRIWVESQPDQGTTFTFTLPVADEE